MGDVEMLRLSRRLWVPGEICMESLKGGTPMELADELSMSLTPLLAVLTNMGLLWLALGGVPSIEKYFEV
jgi:hypothetical protein